MGPWAGLFAYVFPSRHSYGRPPGSSPGHRLSGGQLIFLLDMYLLTAYQVIPPKAPCLPYGPMCPLGPPQALTATTVSVIVLVVVFFFSFPVQHDFSGVFPFFLLFNDPALSMTQFAEVCWTCLVLCLCIIFYITNTDYTKKKVLLKDYHTALILAQVKTWFPQLHDTRWLELEKSQVTGNNLYDLLLVSNLHTHVNTALSPKIVDMLQAWKTFSAMQFRDSVTKTLPLIISSIPLIIQDLHISHWTTKGIKVVEDIMVGPTPKTFRAFQLEYGIEERDKYRYLQITVFIFI